MKKKMTRSKMKRKMMRQRRRQRKRKEKRREKQMTITVAFEQHELLVLKICFTNAKASSIVSVKGTSPAAPCSETSKWLEIMRKGLRQCVGTIQICAPSAIQMPMASFVMTAYERALPSITLQDFHLWWADVSSSNKPRVSSMGEETRGAHYLFQTVEGADKRSLYMRAEEAGVVHHSSQPYEDMYARLYSGGVRW
ncbi:hypothetical protein LTS10_000585 [Elasticomyces elasticus]|nr:hypothetical protein LTS10_000585 [Elasticomyces elasticus]